MVELYHTMKCEIQKLKKLNELIENKMSASIKASESVRIKSARYLYWIKKF